MNVNFLLNSGSRKWKEIKNRKYSEMLPAKCTLKCIHEKIVVHREAVEKKFRK